MNHMPERKHHMHKHSFFQDKLPLQFNEVKSDHMTAVIERYRERRCVAEALLCLFECVITDSSPAKPLRGPILDT